jgi:outer membrane protein
MLITARGGKMKKTLIFVMVMLAFSWFAFSEIKIGVINAQKVIQETKKGKEITAKLEKLGQGKQQQVEALREEIKKLEKDSVSPALNDQTREKKNSDLVNKRTELKRFIEDAQREMQQKSANELNTLRQDIMPVIEKIGKEKGFSLILDLTTSGIAYYDSAIDVTNEVIAEYDKKYGGK